MCLFDEFILIDTGFHMRDTFAFRILDMGLNDQVFGEELLVAEGNEEKMETINIYEKTET